MGEALTRQREVLPLGILVEGDLDRIARLGTDGLVQAFDEGVAVAEKDRGHHGVLGQVGLDEGTAAAEAMAMAIGCALAAAGGTLAGSLFALSPFMGLPPLVKGMTIIVIGGMGSLPGAFIAGMILGLIDGLVPILFGHVWAAMGPLLMVILILVIKPQGFFGHAE